MEVGLIAQRCWWLGAVVFVGCTGGPESTSLTVTEVDSAGVAIVTITGEVADLPEWHLAESPQFTVDGSEPPFLARVGQAALLSDGQIVVGDAQADQLHLFGLEGEHIRMLGDQGDGPGEYQGVTKITVGAGDSLFVYDQRHGRLSVVHPEAGFVRAVSFRTADGVRGPTRVSWVSPGRLLIQRETSPADDVSQSSSYLRQNLVHISLADGEGNQVTESIDMPGGSRRSPRADQPPPHFQISLPWRHLRGSWCTETEHGTSSRSEVQRSNTFARSGGWAGTDGSARKMSRPSASGSGKSTSISGLAQTSPKSSRKWYSRQT